MKSKLITTLLIIILSVFSQNAFSQSIKNNVSPKVKTMLDLVKRKNTVQNTPLYKRASTLSLLDSVVTYDTEGNMIKYFYTYNSDGYMLTRSNAKLIDGIWENDIRMSYSYDSDNNMILGLGSMWGDGEWVEIMKTTATYSGDFITEEQSEILMGDTWILGNSSTYTYDSSTRTLVEVSSGSFSSYEERISEVYDEKGNVISTLEESKSDDYDWTKIEFTEYTYNSNNQETERISMIWDETQWVNSTKYTSSYNENNNRTKEISQYWYDGEWINSQKNEISFNEKNYMKEYLSSYWGDNDWIEYWKYSYEYSADGSTFHGTSVANKTGAWEPYAGEFNFFGSKGYYNDNSQFYVLDAAEINAYFGTITGVEDATENTLPSDFVLEQNYPNPFNPTTSINFTIPAVGMRHGVSVQLNVYNLLGQKVATLVNEQKAPGNYTVEFDTNGLTSGIYFYRLSAGNTSLTKKMMLLR